MKDIVFSTTTQLAAAIGARHVSATEVLDAHLAQIERHNLALNAIVTMDAEGARERARDADAALLRGERWFFRRAHGWGLSGAPVSSPATRRRRAAAPPWAKRTAGEDTGAPLSTALTARPLSSGRTPATSNG